MVLMIQLFLLTCFKKYNKDIDIGLKRKKKNFLRWAPTDNVANKRKK